MLGSWRARAVLIGLLIVQPVLAKTVFQKGDWQLDDSNPGDPKNGTCVASTATHLDNRGVYSLDVVIDKAGTMPLELYIHPQKSPSKVQAFKADFGHGVVYNFALLPRIATQPDTFWQIPRGTDKFVTELKEGNQINIDAVGGGELPFSLSGSTATINELIKRCGAQSLGTAVEFERAFLPPEVNSLDVTKLNPATTEALRKTEAQAVTAFRNVLAIQNELAVLEAQFKALTQEQTSLQAQLDQLINRDLAQLTTARNAAQATIDSANQQIASLQAQIAAAQSNLAQAQAAYQQALSRIQPHIPQHDRLQDQVDNDQARLNNAQGNLASIDQGIWNDQQTIANLQNEAANLRRAVQQRQSELQQAQAWAAQAQADYNNFNPQFEIQRRMNADGRLNQIDNDIRNMRFQEQQAAQQVRAAQMELDQANRALQQCLASGGRFTAAAAPDRMQVMSEGLALGGVANPVRPGPGMGGMEGPGPGRGPGGPGFGPGPGMGGGPGRGPGPGDSFGPGPGRGPGPGPGAGGPGPGHGPGPGPGHGPGPGFGPGPGRGPGGPGPTPPPPPPPPPPDCSPYRNQVATAQQRLSNAQNTLSQWQWQIQNRSNERNAIVQQIQNDVFRQRDDLAARASAGQARVAQLQAEVNGMFNRIADIEQNQLPRYQNELTNLQARRPGAQAEVQAAQSALTNSTNALQAFNRSVNWDALKAQLDQTAANVSNIQAQIANLNSQVDANQRVVRDQTARRDSLNQQIASTNAVIQQKQSRLAQVQAALAPYNQQKADIVARLQAAQATVAAIGRDFASQIPH